MVYVRSDTYGNERRFNSILKQINLRSGDAFLLCAM